jgi:hypothetical protein
MRAESKNFFITNFVHILTPPLLISWHPTHLWLFAHLLTETVNVWVATPIWPTPRSWTEGSSATDFYLEKSRPGLRPTSPPTKLVLRGVFQGNRSWYKAERLLHPVPRLRMNGATLLLPLSALSPHVAHVTCVALGLKMGGEMQVWVLATASCKTVWPNWTGGLIGRDITNTRH